MSAFGSVRVPLQILKDLGELLSIDRRSQLVVELASNPNATRNHHRPLAALQGR